MKDLPETDLVTVPCRLSFPALWTPRPKSLELKDSTDPKDLVYSATLLLPPGTDLTPFKAAVRAAMLGRWGEIVRLKHPVLRRAEDREKETEGYDPGWVYLSASNTARVPVVDRRAVPVDDQSSVYAGMWVLAYLNAYAWEHKVGGRGVSWGLNGIQVYKDDKPFGNVRQVRDVFEALDLTDDDQGADDLGIEEQLDLEPAPARRQAQAPARRSAPAPQARPAARSQPAASPGRRPTPPPQQRRPAPRQETLDDFLGDADGFDDLNDLG